MKSIIAALLLSTALAAPAAAQGVVHANERMFGRPVSNVPDAPEWNNLMNSNTPSAAILWGVSPAAIAQAIARRAAALASPVNITQRDLTLAQIAYVRSITGYRAAYDRIANPTRAQTLAYAQAEVNRTKLFTDSMNRIGTREARIAIVTGQMAVAMSNLDRQRATGALTLSQLRVREQAVIASALRRVNVINGRSATATPLSPLEEQGLGCDNNPQC